MENLPAGWDVQAHRHWRAGERQAAFDAVTARLNTAGAGMPLPTGLQFAYYLAMVDDWQMAARVLSALHQAHPTDREVLRNLGACRSRAGDARGAIAAYEPYLRQWPEDFDAWDGLTNALSACGREAEARHAGERSLTLKDQAAERYALSHPWPLPSGSTAEHLRGRNRQVISYSLWGHKPRYLRGALRNALLAPDLMPGWTCRFYLDRSVPAEFIATLEALGADLRMADPSEDSSSRTRLCRRFRVANDPEVGRFLVRDSDSVLSARESRAVQAWVDSGRWFHVMRDWWTHTDPMLAGLWGGIAGILPDLEQMLADYQGRHLDTPNADQWFLRDRVWPIARASCLIHDRHFNVLGAQPWPGPPPSGSDHVGQDEYAAHRDRQARWLAAWIERLPCLQG
jgi:tetratricopeptide (TPR) repeat protein